MRGLLPSALPRVSAVIPPMSPGAGVAAWLAAACILAPATDAAAATVRVGMKDAEALPRTMIQLQPGDTLMVGPGEYRGRFILPSGVVMQSEAGPDSTWIRGSLIATIEVHGTSGGTEIRGFTMTGRGGADLGVQDMGSGVLVEDNVFLDLHDGVSVEGGDPVIRKNRFRGCRRGVALVVANGLIEQNDFEGCRTGIDLNSASPLIRGNRITRASEGIVLLQYSYPIIGGELALANDFSQNTRHIVNRAYLTIGVQRTTDPAVAQARYNYWGEPCPPPIKFTGTCRIRPWTDETHSRAIMECPPVAAADTTGRGAAGP